MVDFANTEQGLANTFLTAESSVDKKIESLAPVVPSVNFTSTLPQSVKESIESTRLLEKKARNEEIRRNQEMINSINSTSSTLNDADLKIENSRNNIFGSLIGMFNDDYDVSEQRRRKTEAIRNYETKITVNKLKTSSARLAVENEAAVFNNYIQRQKLRTQNSQLTSADLSAVVQSNSARKALQEFEFSKLTMEDLQRRKRTGDFDEIATEQRINKLFTSIRESELDMRSAELAYKAKDFDLGVKMEDRSILNLPENYLRAQYDAALKAKQSRVQLGKNFYVAPSKVLAAIGEKSKINEEFLNTETDKALKFVKNNASFTKSIQQTNIISQEFSGSSVLPGAENLNILNVDQDVVAEIDFTNLHPGVSSEYLALMTFTSNLNSSETQSTPQDFRILDKLTVDLQEKINAIKKQAIDSQPTKPLKAAQEEWFLNNGKLVSGVNASAVVVGNITTMPDFQGDRDLASAWRVFGSNILESIGGDGGNLIDPSGNLDSNAFLESLLTTSFRGKQTDQDKILLAMSTVDDNGQTPLTAYASSKSRSVLIESATAMSNSNAFVKQALFDAKGNPSSNWQNSPLELSKILARVSIDQQKIDPTLGNNFLNIELGGFINKTLAENADRWKAQTSLSQGAFLVTLFKNQEPFVVVDTVLENVWKPSIVRAWDLVSTNILEEEASAERSLNFTPNAL